MNATCDIIFRERNIWVRYHCRVVACNYERIGCPWKGPFHELADHVISCAHPRKSGDEIMASLQVKDKERQAEVRLHESMLNLLSFEKIAFSGMYRFEPSHVWEPGCVCVSFGVF